MTTSLVVGFTLALVAGFCAVTTFIVTEVQTLAAYRLVFTWAWAAISAGLGLRWLVLRRRRIAAGPAVTAAASEEEGEARPSPLGGSAYWMVVTGLLAVISFFIHPWEKLPATARQPAPPPVRRTNAPPPVPPPVVVTAAPVPRVEVDPFAKVRTLRVQGVTLNGANSTVILSGRTYALGEMVDGAKITFIYASGVDFEKDGKTWTLRPGQ